jgi:hypothetical protein
MSSLAIEGCRKGRRAAHRFARLRRPGESPAVSLRPIIPDSNATCRESLSLLDRPKF